MAIGPFATINLNLLRVFDALYQEGHVTRAAERVGVTQPAVSHSLGQLRELFGDPLFERRGVRMVATPLAAALGPRIHAALHQVEEALSPAPFDPATTTRLFTLATGDNVGTVLAPAIVAAIRAQAPEARIRIVPLTADLLEGLDDGRIDVAISSFATIPERLTIDRLWAEAPRWMVRDGHPALGQRLNGAALAAFDRVVVDLDAAHAGGSPDGFVAQGGLTQWTSADDPQPAVLPRRLPAAQQRVVVPSFHTAIALARESDLAVLLPRRLAAVAARDQGLVPLDTVEPAAERTLMALWHGERVGHPAVAWLRTLILECSH